MFPVNFAMYLRSHLDLKSNPLHPLLTHTMVVRSKRSPVEQWIIGNSQLNKTVAINYVKAGAKQYNLIYFRAWLMMLENTNG